MLDPPIPADRKTALRRTQLARRAARRAAEIERARTGVRQVVLARWEQARWACVAGYLPLRTEPGSAELLEALDGSGVRVLVPLLLPDRDLDWARWPGDEPLGRAAIASADAVLVPALAVDRRGVRLGRGGGSYDRALARVAVGTVVAALLFDGELSEQPLPADPWDVPVRAVVTPGEWQDLYDG